MTKLAITKRIAVSGEDKIEISVVPQGKQYYATCNYPAPHQLKVERHPYHQTGARVLVARVPLAANEKAAVDSLLDLLEKKLGKRPTLEK